MSTKGRRSGTQKLLNTITKSEPDVTDQDSKAGPSLSKQQVRVKKNITLLPDTIRGLQLIQFQALQDGKKKPTEGGLVDEAVRLLLKEKGVSLEQ